VTQPAFVCGYEILAELGRGTTGTVYKARHPVLKPDRLVALKSPALGAGPDAASRLARYQNEWNALRVLTWESDPAIPTLYDVGCDSAGQNNYYVREFVDGGTLEELVAGGSVGPARVFVSSRQSPALCSGCTAEGSRTATSEGRTFWCAPTARPS
jgi:serine/threonine protein kinase